VNKQTYVRTQRIRGFYDNALYKFTFHIHIHIHTQTNGRRGVHTDGRTGARVMSRDPVTSRRRRWYRLERVVVIDQSCQIVNDYLLSDTGLLTRSLTQSPIHRRSAVVWL